MCDLLYVLGNRRPFVEVGRNIMSSDANRFYTPFMCMMIGSRTLESRYEGVVDIDTSAV